MASTALAQSEKVIYSFADGDGSPQGGLVIDAQGNLYGTTDGGGAGTFCFGCGSVFELSPNTNGTWTKTVLYSFGSVAGDGLFPFSPLVFDAKGNLYGTTTQGGASSLGTVFELSPVGDGTWTEKILHSFTGGSDGRSSLLTGVVLDASGNLYGIAQGGVHGFGAIYQLSPSANGSWSKKTLYNFTGGKDGGNPSNQQLLLDSKGNVYGQAALGGAFDYGVVFELVRGTNGVWSETVLHSFTGFGDGSAGVGGLAIDSAGNLYGNSIYSVFQLSPGASGTWTENQIHIFTGGTDGAEPEGALSFTAAAGKIYGTTYTGGLYRGTVFQLGPETDGTWTEKILHKFRPTGGDAIDPIITGFAIDATGKLYGTTTQGGASNLGAVYEVTP